MELLKKFLPMVIRKQLNKFANRQTKYIFYRIIAVDQSMQKYTLQCINTRSIFYASLADIVFDKNIIYRLHPIQACYMGIEYSKSLEKGSISIPKNYSDTHNPFITSHGTYRLRYQDRKSNLCFVNHKTGEEFMMNPCDIILSEALIDGFDATQAFHIGLLAGIKMLDTGRRRELCKLYNQPRRPYLWLVK
jgi:hypothetical protein